MSIKKYTKNFFFREGASTAKSKQVIAASPSVGEIYTNYNYGFNDAYEEHERQYALSNFYNGYSGSWYYDKSHCQKYTDALLRGTMHSSLTSLASAMLGYITTQVENNQGVQSTFMKYVSQVAGLTSRYVGFWGASDSGSWVIPDIMMTISNNHYSTTSVPYRIATIGIQILIEKRTYDNTNAVWTGSSGAPTTLFEANVTDARFPEGVLTMIERILQRAAKVQVVPGCGLTETIVSQSGGIQYRFTAQRNYEDRYFCIIKGDPVYSAHGFGLVYKADGNKGTVNGNWTASSTDIDPVDPFIEPDPYDPVPPDPIPPGPDPDPTPIIDPIPIPDMPPIDGVAVGVYKAYKPSSGQLQQIASKLWDPDAWNAIKQMFTNPMEAIFGLAIVPVNPVVGATLPVYLGRYNTGVSVPVIANDYVNVDCGSVAIKKFYGSYLDHDPYTKYSLYLPYIGEMDINADEITGRVMHIEYHCNVITGDVTALVALDGRVCYTGMGNFIRQLPLSQVDYSSIIQTAVSAASTVITAAVAGVGGAAVAGAAGEATIAKTRAEARVASTVANGTTSLLNDVMGAKFNYKHAGKIGQGAGQLSVQKPFLTITRPNLALPENNNASAQSNLKAYTGYPCNKILQLSSCHGFTQIEACKLEIPDATDSELAEVYELLKGGVLF